MGSLVRIPFGHRRVRGVVRSVELGPTTDLAEVAGVVVEPSLAPGAIGELLDWIAERYAAPRGRVFGRIVPPRVRVRLGDAAAPGRGPDATRLLAYENGDRLLDHVARGATGTWLVQALPGETAGALASELAAVALRAGAGGALVLVPEVRYGSPAIDAMERAFGAVARLDSAQPDPERARSWLDVAAGARLAAGGRAAVLAPMRDLRLVVVDDAHARAYKEERSPRYDARVVAAERARLQGATCVFVTPTPPMELAAGAASGGAGIVWAGRELRRAARPLVQLVEPPDAGLSRELHRAVRETLAAGGRVGLLAPLPGYARALWCAACRRSVRCSRCEAGMVFERAAHGVRCPRCGAVEPAPDRCPACGSSELRMLGAGSERLAEQVQRSFPRARVQRMDPQVLAGGGARASDAARADIYLTTWIGAKEVLRPSVTTVGVLDADAWIRRPEFRAAENAYQALAEMAEWAGPAAAGGRLLIQTAEPGHHAVQAVVRGDPGHFFQREATQRAELGYPPYSELIKVRADGPQRDGLAERASAVARRHGAQVLGPIRVRAAAGERIEVLLKCAAAQPVARDLRGILPEVPRGSRLVVDVDPV